jgi:hypothetical protein
MRVGSQTLETWTAHLLLYSDLLTGALPKATRRTHTIALTFYHLGPDNQAPQALWLRVVKARQGEVEILIATRRLGARR